MELEELKRLVTMESNPEAIKALAIKLGFWAGVQESMHKGDSCSMGFLGFATEESWCLFSYEANKGSDTSYCLIRLPRDKVSVSDAGRFFAAVQQSVVEGEEKDRGPVHMTDIISIPRTDIPSEEAAEGGFCE